MIEIRSVLRTLSSRDSYIRCKIVYTSVRSIYGLRPVIVFLIRFLLLTASISSTHGCWKSSIYYRSRIRTRSHVFAPGEYQPRQWEHTAEASGPLDVRDFQHTVPSKRLVRVTSPHILFDTEEARWMTKGCRDRLLKLSTQIQNTWAKQDVVLRVNRAWIQPPARHRSKATNSKSDATSQDTNTGAAESLLYNRESASDTELTTSRVPMQQTASTFLPVSTHRDKMRLGHPQSVSNSEPESIIDMTPEMMVDENHPSSVRKASPVASQPISIRYDYLHAPSASIPSKWSSVQSFRYGSASTTRTHSGYLDQPYARQAPLRYYPSIADLGPTRRTFRNPVATKMMRLPRHARSTLVNRNDTTGNESKSTRTARKVGRSIYSLPMPLDTGYTSVNTMSQLAFERWLQIRMEEFHYAGRAVDLQLVSRTGYINTRSPEFSLGVLAQIAYYVAQFDWCYFSRAGHIHCSVKPDASITSQWFGCFPASAKFNLENGRSITAAQLKVGDRVLTQNTYTGELFYTPIVAFLHRDEHAWSPMLKVIYQVPKDNDNDNRTLYLTPDHLIYIKSKSSGHITTVFASSLRHGNTIIISPMFRNHSVTEAMVMRTELVHKSQTELNGLYAPLTEVGSVIVDEVFVSCFAYFIDPNLAYFTTLPLQWINRFTKWFDWPESSSNDTSIGIHWYLELLLRWIMPILPETLFYAHA